jgi:G:T-mismatch repair DNA endonuclease (very short patch repair protein)
MGMYERVLRFGSNVGWKVIVDWICAVALPIRIRIGITLSGVLRIVLLRVNELS